MRYLLLIFAFSVNAHAGIASNTSERPMQKLAGHVQILKDQKLIRFATYDHVFFLKFAPVAIHNRLQLKNAKPDKEVVLEFKDSEVDHIEQLTPADQQAWQPQHH